MNCRFRLEIAREGCLLQAVGNLNTEETKHLKDVSDSK